MPRGARDYLSALLTTEARVGARGDTKCVGAIVKGVRCEPVAYSCFNNSLLLERRELGEVI